MSETNIVKHQSSPTTKVAADNNDAPIVVPSRVWRKRKIRPTLNAARSATRPTAREDDKVKAEVVVVTPDEMSLHSVEDTSLRVKTEESKTDVVILDSSDINVREVVVASEEVKPGLASRTNSEHIPNCTTSERCVDSTTDVAVTVMNISPSTVEMQSSSSTIEGIGRPSTNPTNSESRIPTKRVPKRQRFMPTLKTNRPKQTAQPVGCILIETAPTQEENETVCVVKDVRINVPDSEASESDNILIKKVRYETVCDVKDVHINVPDSEASENDTISMKKVRFEATSEKEEIMLSNETGVVPNNNAESMQDDVMDATSKSELTASELAADVFSVGSSHLNKRKKFMPNLGPNVRQRSHPATGNLSEDDGSQSEGYVSDHGAELKKTTKGARTKQPVSNKHPACVDISNPSKATIADLLYSNPSNGKAVDPDPVDKEMSVAEKTFEMLTEQGQSTAKDVAEKDGADAGAQMASDCVMAPQVKVAADGSLILNEESLYIQKTGADKDMSKVEVVFEEGFTASKKRGRRRHWSIEDTLQFYKALSQVGTDFGLMAQMFPQFTRNQLKTKFKKEEKWNCDLIDRALRNRLPINLELFTIDCKENDKEGSLSNEAEGTLSNKAEGSLSNEAEAKELQE